MNKIHGILIVIALCCLGSKGELGEGDTLGGRFAGSITLKDELAEDAILETKLGGGTSTLETKLGGGTSTLESEMGRGITCRAKNNTRIFVNLMMSGHRLNIPCPSTDLPSVDHLIQMVASLPKETSRKISALVGAVVADAASLPLQWIYEDMENVGGWRMEGDSIVGGHSPAFYPARHCKLFTGGNSCYADEIKTCLGVLAGKNGKLDVGSLKQRIQTHFGAKHSPYQKALATRPEFFKFDHWRSWQVAQNNALLPWLNGCVIRSLKNMDEAKPTPGDGDCRDNDGFTLALPAFLVNFKEKDAEGVAKVLTTNPTALNHIKVQNKIIQNFIQNVKYPVKEALRWVKFQAQFNDQFPQIVREITHVEEAMNSGKSVVEVVEDFGKACGLPGSFQGSLAFLVNGQPFGGKFSSAVESNIVAGGDCCARANFIGAAVGAKLGIQAIPVDWIQRVDGIQEIIQNAVNVYGNKPQKQKIVIDLKKSNAF